MRTKIFFVVFVLASLLAGCSRAASKAPIPTPLSEERVSQIAAQAAAEAVAGVPIPEPITQQEIAAIAELAVDEAIGEIPQPMSKEEVSEIVSQALVEAQPVEEPEEPEPILEPEPVYPELILANCPLEDKGVRLEFEGPNEGEFYLLSGLSEDFVAYEGCNFLFEGRQFLTEEHHIWIFEGPDWQLKVREGSLWAYPINWNMADFTAEKAPITTEFVVAKRNNMLENGYEWPIFVHTLSGNTVVFPEGSQMPEVVLPDNADFAEPEPLVVQGVWNGEMFDASIGAENTITVALLDGQLLYWANAQDNIVYKTVEAWIMPSGWSMDQIESWAEAQFPGKNLGAYAP